MTLKDAKGKIVGVSTLGPGQVQNMVHLPQSTSYDCVFRFAFKKVPDSSAFYSVEVGQRAPMTFPKADLKRDGWKFQIQM